MGKILKERTDLINFIKVTKEYIPCDMSKPLDLSKLGLPTPLGTYLNNIGTIAKDPTRTVIPKLLNEDKWHELEEITIPYISKTEFKRLEHEETIKKWEELVNE